MAFQSFSRFRISSESLSQPFQGDSMTSYQRARRIAAWRGSFSMLFACTFFMLASALAGNITS